MDITSVFGTAVGGSNPPEGKRSEPESEQTALLARRIRKDFCYEATKRSEIKNHRAVCNRRILPRANKNKELFDIIVGFDILNIWQTKKKQVLYRKKG